MSYEKRDNSGTLGKNKRKEKDTHPDSSGSATIEGVDYWISGWTKTGPTGEKFSSLSFKRKEQQPAQATAPTSRAPVAAAATTGDDDLPF